MDAFIDTILVLAHAGGYLIFLERLGVSAFHHFRVVIDMVAVGRVAVSDAFERLVVGDFEAYIGGLAVIFVLAEEVRV